MKLTLTRRTIRTVQSDGSFIEEEWTAVPDFVELSVSAAQAKEQGLMWAPTVNCKAENAEEAGAAAHAQIVEQVAAAKA